MANGNKQNPRRIYGIALSCVIILAGVCLMTACVGIYLSGEDPFSREAVAAAFSPIAFPVYLCLVMVPVGFLLNRLFPAPAQKAAPLKQNTVTLKRLQSRVDLEHCDEALLRQIRSEQSRRQRLSLVRALVLAVSALVFLSYALNSSHFHSSDINGSMIRATAVLMPCLAVSLAICIWVYYAGQTSMLREIEALKQCPKLTGPAPEPAESASGQQVKYVLLLAGAALLVFGFLTGGTADVLTKAVNICTECIGLG